MREKEQRFILSILSKTFKSEEDRLSSIAVDKKREEENYYSCLLQNDKACIVSTTDGKK